MRQGTKEAAKFAHHTNSSNWETLASRRKSSRICALFKAFSGERAWQITKATLSEQDRSWM